MAVLNVFHSTVTEGPTDYLNKKKTKMSFFDHIYYGLKFNKRADVCVCLCMYCKYHVNSPESTSMLMYVNIERLLMVTGFVTLSSAVGASGF